MMLPIRMNWLALGKIENWVLSFNSGGTWGLRPTQIGLWETLEIGDQVFFYITSPISGIVGQGTITNKFRQDKPLWPEEVKNNEVIFPLRFHFDIQRILEQDQWIGKKVGVSDLRLPLMSGFQVLNEKTAEEISGRLRKNLAETSGKTISVSTTDLKAPVPSEHNRIRDILVEMGRMQGYYAEKEYLMDGFRLDAVWRKIIGGSPLYVFEVQVGGSVEQAMGKLKHAYDKWNSNIFIALDDKDEQKAQTLLSGTFHEISGRIRIIKLKDINEIYPLKKSFKDMERTLGLN